MIYLAGPYSDQDPAVRLQRFRRACRVAAELVNRGEVVFAPICHSHPMTEFGLPTDWPYWERQDREFLKRCDEVVVLTLPGWEQSRGVQAEIRIAAELGKPIRYLDPEELSTVSQSLSN